MFWAKRRFAYAEYAPYMDRLEKLLMATPAQYQQFIMVSTRSEKTGVSEYYVGVPLKVFLAAFDGFEAVEEADLPKVIVVLHIACGGSDEFTSRFQFGDPLNRRR